MFKSITKKLFLPLVLTVMFFTFLCLTTSAKSNTPISPALSVIAGQLNMKKCGIAKNDIYFSAKDFSDFLNLEQLKQITITSLPSEFEGKMYLEGVPVISNQTIFSSDIEKLYFKPSSSDISTSTFHFSGNDTSCDTSLKCSIYLLKEPNYAPVISQQTSSGQRLTTQKNIIVYSTLRADDPEKDELTFEITTPPRYGIAKINDTLTGEYCYIPSTDYVGKDSFEYVAVDRYGNRSDIATVEIKVEKSVTNAVYTDMLWHKDHNDAVKITSYNIMSGELIDGKLCFSPSDTPTKSEFLVMALKAAKKYNSVEVVNTGFTDDADIPLAHKGYVAYASEMGYIEGIQENGGIYFRPNAPITRAEAAVLISNILDADESYTHVDFSDKADIPSWAEGDIMTLAQMGIMGDVGNGVYAPNSNVTNIDAAKILCRIYEK